MHRVSRRGFLYLTAAMGGAFAVGDVADRFLRRPFDGLGPAPAWADDTPIKIGILDPLSGPYRTSSIHDVHGATVAVDLYNKSGGVLGRPVMLLEADDASNVETALKAATKLIQDDHVDFLMGTFNGDVALAVSDLAKKENKLFMVTGAVVPELTGSRCSSHTYVFMPNSMMLARAVVPQIIKAYGNKWYMVTTDSMDGRAARDAMHGVLLAQGGQLLGDTLVRFGSTDYTSALTKAKTAQPNAMILNLYGWDLVQALKTCHKLDLAKDRIGVGGLLAGEQVGRPLGYESNQGIWGLVWDPKINTPSSKRFIQGVIDKYNHTPTSRCYLGYAAASQILEAVKRAGTTSTSNVLEALEGHEFDGCKEGRSYFRRTDHQHVQDVLVGKAYGKELGLGHYQILATQAGDTVAGPIAGNVCRFV